MRKMAVLVSLCVGLGVGATVGSLSVAFADPPVAEPTVVYAPTCAQIEGVGPSRYAQSMETWMREQKAAGAREFVMMTETRYWCAY